MNNIDVELILNDCDTELSHIQTLIVGLGPTSLVTPFLNKYAVIKACGTIEIAFKTVIADYCSKRSKPQVKNYLNKKVRENSSNPSYSRIMQILQEFDNAWANNFRVNVGALPNSANVLTSIQSLVNARNDFAHGGNPTLSFADVYKYYNDSRIIIETLDQVVG